MHTILLVEDEPIIALTERRILEARGYAVTTAQNGAEAIELARTHEDLDLVLMDIDLGSGPDGVETAEALLSFRQLPVVFLTSHTGQDIVERVQAVSSYGYVVKSSGEFVLLESIRMALQLFEAHTGLARRKEFIEAVLDVLPVGIATTDLQSGTSDYLNRAFEQIYGWPFEVIADVDRFFEAVYPDPEYRAQIRSKVMDDIATGDPGKMIWDNVRITTRDGEERIIRAQNIPIPGQKRMISTVMDRTEQKRTLYALQASERKYRSMLESLQEGIIQINAEGIITFVNTPMADMIGYSVDEISGKTLPDFMDDEGKQLITEAIERRRTGVAEQMDAHFLHRDGHRVYVMVGTAPLFDADGAYAGAIAGIMDMTTRAQYEHALQKQVQEKSTLLRETYHRVKNNIATVGSLLSLQASTTDEASARRALYEAISRVRSMQKLFDTMLLRDVDGMVMLDRYVSKIVELVAELFDGTKSINIVTDLDSCSTRAQDAFSVGIIVNELLTNVMKYAFSEESEKEALVSLRCTGEQSVLCVRDNGRGFQGQRSLETSEGFGLSLVEMLCEQLGADLRKYNDGGAVVEVTFTRHTAE